MAFNGTGAGRFQIRRLRNGSTAESIITANRPRFQDFAEPTGVYNPNWNSTEEAGDVTDFDSTATYSVGNEVEYLGGIYRAEVVLSDPVPVPTTMQSDSNWEYEGPIGLPLRLTPSLLVNGVDIAFDGARHASPVNALILTVTWAYLNNAGTYTNVATSNNGWSLASPGGHTLNEQLVIERNIGQTAGDFPAGAIMDNTIFLRCTITYNITGVLTGANTLQTLTSTSFVEIRKNILTESSMFARILLTEQVGQAGASSQIWNSGFTGSKTFRADLIIGAAIRTTSVTYEWFNSNSATINIGTDRNLTITRADVDTAETYFCVVTDQDTNTEYVTNTIELRDFLDPVQFVEIGTATVDTGSNAMVTILPYQNGKNMAGLTAANTSYRFEILRQANATDMTGTEIPWLTSAGAGGLSGAARFEGSNAGTYSNSDVTDGYATTGHDPTIMGVTINITDTELGAFGAFIDYDVTFTAIAN